MFKTNIQKLKGLADAKTPVVISLVPTDKTADGYVMTVKGDFEFYGKEETGIVYTKSDAVKVYKNLNRAVAEIERIFPTLPEITITTVYGATE